MSKQKKLESPSFQYTMAAEQILTQEKDPASCPWQAKTTYWAFLLSRHIAHFTCTWQCTSSCWKQIPCRGGAGGQGLGEQPGSCPAAGMPWQCGRQGLCQLAQQLSQLFFSSQPCTQRAGGDCGLSCPSPLGLGGLQARFCLTPGNMEMRGRCCHQKWLWGGCTG